MFGFLRNLFIRSETAPAMPPVNDPARQKHIPVPESEMLGIFIRELETGHVSYLSSIYAFLVSDDLSIVEKAAIHIAKYARLMNVKSLIQLDEMFRGYRDMAWPTDWKYVDLSRIEKAIDNRDDFLWVVRIGTFHNNGYYREKCIRYLKDDHDSYIFIFLRLNDWVREVRQAAFEALESVGELNADELMSCLSVLEKLRRSGRRDYYMMKKLDAKVSERIRALAPVFDWQMIKKYDESTRRFLYRNLLENDQLSKDEIYSILEHENSPKCQLLMMAMFLNNYELSVEEVDRFLRHKSLIVQYKALEQKYKITGKPWDGIEELLLSPSRRIREYVRYILNKHTDFDCRSYYIHNLETPARAVCILGIGETGRPEDSELILKYVDDENFRIVRNTIKAIGALNPPETEEILWKLLQDERLPVMVQAYRIIIDHNIKCGAERIYALFEQTGSEMLRKKLAALLAKESYWDRIPYILMLYSYDEEDIHESVLKGLTRRANTYASVTGEKAARIEEILDDERYAIPEKIKQRIRFNISISKTK